MRIRAKIKSPVPNGTSFEVRRSIYVGVEIRKSRNIWPKEMKTTLNRKKAAGGTFARIIFLIDY